MEEKTEIVEKRVRSTVIRRRKQVVQEPVIQEVPVKETKASKEVPLEVDIKGVLPGQEVLVEAKKQTPSDQKAKPAAKKTEDIQTAAGVLLTAEEELEAKRKKNKKGPKRREDVLEIEGIGKVSSVTQLTRIVHTDRIDRVFEPSRQGRRKKIISRKSQKQTQITQTKSAKRIVPMTGSIFVGDLAKTMGIKSGQVIKKLMDMGTMATINQVVDFETASIIAHEFGYEVKDIRFNEEKFFKTLDQGTQEKIEPRSPVVTVMGHVDHGKTSLLDAIRQTNVAAGEHGGITQHIGAYSVSLPKPQGGEGKITFLDTPGHEAFTAMRARGAAVTDIVVLVVAADDGVMPQTIESIHHAKAAGVPIVVAVNKIDKPGADPEKIKRQLSEHQLVSEDWGGDVMFCPVSAKQKQGIDSLLESILLQAEVLELKANPYVHAQGIVVEARLDRQKGPIATVLVQEGTLEVGHILVAGDYLGRLKAMNDHRGIPITEAGPSTAVEILGLEGVPQASDPFHVVDSEQDARQIIENRLANKKKISGVATPLVSLEDFFNRQKEQEAKVLNVILKGDVQGSVEAVGDALKKLSTEKVKVKLIHQAAGGITESDILLASASQAIIIGFNVRPETKALGLAKNEGVDVKLYQIIYEMVEEVKLAMRGLLAPKKKETYMGRAEVKEAFEVSKIGLIAGSLVIDGKITRNASIRFLRDNVVLHEGKITSLKRFKDDVKEVAKGLECGIGIEGYQNIKSGDLIEAFEVEYIAAEL